MSRALRLLALGSVLLASVGTPRASAHPGRATAPPPNPPADERPELALAETIRTLFPSVAGRLEGSAGLRPATRRFAAGEVAGHEVVVDAASQLQVFLPSCYDGPFVAERGSQRIVLRAVGARGATAAVAGGLAAFEGVYDGVDSLHVAGANGTEEFLLVKEATARRFVEYEVVEAAGVAGIVLRDGKVRFESTDGSAGIELDRPWLVDAEGRTSAQVIAWGIVSRGRREATRLRLGWKDEGLRYPLLVDPSFVVAGTVIHGRYHHAMTLLPNGKILLTGGAGEASALRSAELFDPSTGRALSTGSLLVARSYHTATLLRNGKVLVVGGYDGSYLSSAEIYDPATGAFTATGPLLGPRGKHTATLLPSGKVLVAGGMSANSTYLSSAELFDPAANGGVGGFSATGSSSSLRAYATATLLTSGKVLLAGGYSGAAWLKTADLFDPSGNGGLGSFTATGSSAFVHGYHTATLLATGKVLVAGGLSAASELFDPAGNGGAGAFTATGSLLTARSFHTAALLPSGKVLVAGGRDEGGTNSSLASAELFDPTANAGAGAFSSAGSLNVARERHTATLLPGGGVLFAGGQRYTSGMSEIVVVREVEEFDPGTGLFTTSGSMTSARQYHSATLLQTGKVLVAGGQGPSGYLASAELFDSSAGGGVGAFTATGSLTLASRGYHTATLLPSGKVLVVGGLGAVGVLGSAELFDPAANGGVGAFVSTGSLSTARYLHTATLLPSGKVLVAGGYGYPAGVLASAELFDPSANGGIGAFTSAGSLLQAREMHSATLLADGRVLFAGGDDGTTGSISAAELYDPITGGFSRTGNLVVERRSHSATLLPSGMVLMAGGASYGSFITSTAELYDPSTGIFAMTSDLTSHHYSAAVTGLLSGRVLIAGGWSAVDLNTADVYDPASGTFSSTSTLAVAREHATATLLPSGRVLVAGGSASSSPLASSELFSEGLPPQESWRPVLSLVTNPIAQAGPVSATGSNFTRTHGDGPEASGGGTQSSPTNYPLVQLRRIDNGESVFLPLDPLSGFTATGFMSSRSWTLNPGPALATVFVNGIPSVSKTVVVQCGVTISSHPANQTVAVGSVGTFSVTAVAASRYQWQRDPTASGAWSDVSGATGTTYTTPAVVGPESGTRYRVLVSGTCATVASNPATLTVSDSNPPTASVVSPAGGEYWLLSPTSGPASTQTVAWSMLDDVRVCEVDVALRYSNDGGTTWATAGAGGGLPATYGTGGSCAYPGVATSNLTYTVPTSFPSGRAGSLYKVRLSGIL